MWDQAEIHEKCISENIEDREKAVELLKTNFPNLPDKDLAWQDLIRLTKDQDSFVRWKAAEALGTSFIQVPDKDLAWQDLHRLTKDQDSDVRMYAYHSLGRASVSKATESKDRNSLKKELEAAIAYFEKSSPEFNLSPAKFCHPFYRTYYAITFQEAKEGEVQKYLAEAKEAVGGSESKDDLLNAVENLAEALKESQRLKSRPFEEVASELNTYRWYCEKAAGYMNTAEDGAPGAVKLLRKCNPLLDEKIQYNVAEIQKMAIQICEKISSDSKSAKVFCLQLNKATKSISYVELVRIRQSISILLKELCKLLPENTSLQALGLLDDAYHIAPPEALERINLAMVHIYSYIAQVKRDDPLWKKFEDIEEAINRLGDQVEQNRIIEQETIIGLLRNIEHGISTLKLSSGSARIAIFRLQSDIDILQKQMTLQNITLEELETTIQKIDPNMVKRLNEVKEAWLQDVKRLAKSLPSSKDRDKMLEEIHSLKQSRKGELLGIMGDLSSIAGLFVSLIGLGI